MEQYWLWLHQLKGIGPVTLRKLVSALGTPKAVYFSQQDELQKVKGLSAGVIDTVLKQRSLESAKRVQEQMRLCRIELLTYDAPGFPQTVNRFPGLPGLLFVRGTLRLDIPGIGIVGSRRCTAYGKQVAAEAAAFLGRRGLAVLSGMAKGVDGYAHTACLKADGYTIAFLAGGADICYPPEHQTLMEGILEQGAIITPYPPGTRPLQEYFPYRNKLLAAWCEQLLVVEAAEKSGALLTAGYAMEYEKPVLAVPNSIYSPESAGANRLLLQGGKVYLEPEQLLGGMARVEGRELKAAAKGEPVIDLKSAKSKKNPDKQSEVSEANPQEQIMLNRLSEPQPINSFLDIFAGDLSALLETVCRMELDGLVRMEGQMVKLTV